MKKFSVFVLSMLFSFLAMSCSKDVKACELYHNTMNFESSYLVEIDNRLGRIVSATDRNRNASLSFIDDDNIATYMVDSTQFVSDITDTNLVTADSRNQAPRPSIRREFSPVVDS